jgi:hypothetical protein
LVFGSLYITSVFKGAGTTDGFEEMEKNLFGIDVMFTKNGDKTGKR